jgi:hypothetical protein
MSVKLLDRLLFAQGQCCFFCSQQLPREAASVEHLLAKSHSGNNEFDNCVACCQAVNSMFGNMTLKGKMEVVLRQRGNFRCPAKLADPANERQSEPAVPAVTQKLIAAAVTNLQRHKAARPRTLKALHSAMRSQFAKQLAGASAQSLVDHLRLIGVVVVEEDGTVSYRSTQQSA